MKCSGKDDDDDDNGRIFDSILYLGFVLINAENEHAVVSLPFSNILECLKKQLFSLL